MKTWAMTGASSGFGVEWLYSLDRQQEASWFLLVRDPNRVKQQLLKRPLRGAVELIQCDLSVAASVAAAIDRIGAQTDHLDGLINNAGIFPNVERRVTIDGVEASLAVNVLAPHRLSLGLLPLLKRGNSPRIITTASFRHRDARLDPNNLQLADDYSAQRAYSNTKLCVVLWNRALARQLAGSGVAASCFDPGIVDTPMLRQALPRPLAPLYPLLRKVVARSPSQGAQTGVYLCEVPDPGPYHGGYLKDNRVRQPHPSGCDDEMAEWLWQQCNQLTGSGRNRVTGA